MPEDEYLPDAEDESEAELTEEPAEEVEEGGEPASQDTEDYEVWRRSTPICRCQRRGSGR